jgi:hypothetical protein
VSWYLGGKINAICFKDAANELDAFQFQTLTATYSFWPGNNYERSFDAMLRDEEFILVYTDVKHQDRGLDVFVNRKYAPDFVLAPYILVNPDIVESEQHETTGGASVKLRWKQVPFADRYRLQVSKDSLFLYSLIDDNSIEDTSSIVSNLEYQQRYYWRISSGNSLGWSSFTKKAVFVTGSPPDFSLEQNFPNPFNSITRINYQIPIDGIVNFKIYDILGREISSLTNEYHQSGRYQINFDASKFSSGVYIYKLVSGKFAATKKMMFIK